MIWRILGLIGAGSFFVNGFSLLSDPSCVSADFGGGRVIQVTCREDSYGTFSGTEAGLISLFIGMGLLTLIFFNQIKQFFKKPSLPSEWKNVSISNPDGLVETKICNYCEDPVSLDLQKCPRCQGTYFNYKKVATIAKVKPATKVGVVAADNQIKKCPMCAEEIKFEAMKCRFCQHSFIETDVQKLNSSINSIFKKLFTKPYVGITITIIAVAIICLGYGLNLRSQSIERSQLFASGEVCVGPKGTSEIYGCADYPSFNFSFCTTSPYSDMNFIDDVYTSLGPMYRPGMYSAAIDCSNDVPYHYVYQGEIDKLSGEYEMYLWGHNNAEYVADDLSDLGTLVMKINLKE